MFQKKLQSNKRKILQCKLRTNKRNLEAFKVCYTSQTRLKEDIQDLKLMRNSIKKDYKKFSGRSFESTQGYFESTQAEMVGKKYFGTQEFQLARSPIDSSWV